MRAVFVAGLAALLSLPIGASADLPERRSVVTNDIDYPGRDLQPLFETTLEACERVCLNDPDCGAFTFNARAGACFSKTGAGEAVPFDGAISGRVINATNADIARADARAGDLDFLTEAELDAAEAQARGLGLRYRGGQWSVDALLRAAEDAEARGNLQAATDWIATAVAQDDSAILWLSLAHRARLAANEAGRNRAANRTTARQAAINAYLRAGPDGLRATILQTLAHALEDTGDGRLAISALRLAEGLSPNTEITASLDEMIGKYGFRITETRVESDSAEPRICAVFSEPLRQAGQDYAAYVQLPDPRLAVTPGERDLCVSGLSHGERYRLVFRAGLPAASGETLIRDVPVTQYVRDRAPSARFPGRAYVLPRTDAAGLPVETVNTAHLDLTLRRVSEAALLRVVQQDLFARPLSAWDEEELAATLSETVWEGRVDIDTSLNAEVTTRIPMEGPLTDRAPGIYALAARVPDADPYDDPTAMQWFVVSDIGLTTLWGSDGLTVIARGLSDALPLEGLDLSLMATSMRELGKVVTNAEGVARFPAGLTRGSGAAAPALLVAEMAGDMTFLSLDGPAFDLSDRGVAGREAPGPMDVFLTTERGAYRAGETVHMTALMRDAKAAAISDVPLTAILTRPDGVEHARQVSTQDRAGGHVLAFPLSEAVPRGTWQLAVHADPDAPALASRALLVEDFVPERVDMDLSLPDGAIDPIAPPSLSVQVDYLFGAPGADLPLEGEVRLSGQRSLDVLPGYLFGRHDAESATRTESLPGNLRTDAGGAAELPLPLPESDLTDRPLEATAILRVLDGAARPVERRIARPVRPAGPVIGIRALTDSTIPEGTEARFRVQGFSPDLSPAPMSAEWTLNRVETRYQWYALYGNWNWEPITTRSRVSGGTITLGSDPVEITAPLDWGRYELVVERTDGTYTASSVTVDAGWYAPAGAAETPDMLELSLDRESYGPGDTAQLRLIPRRAGRVLVSVLTERVIALSAHEVPEGTSVIALPVTEEWGTGAYVTAELLSPLDEAEGRNPTRALGLAHASVAPGARQLDVSIDAVAEAMPRGPLDVTVRVPNAGAGAAHVTLAAVDQGILNLTGFETPDPAGHYFGQKRLGVEIRDLYGRLIDGQTGALGRIRSGGDAMGRMEAQSPPPTEALLAFFEGPLSLDEAGEARVTLDLPTFNGEVRLMALAWTDTAVGAAEAEVLVRDPVVLQAALPRFLAPGDAARLSLDLTHATGPAGDITLAVTAPGLEIDTSALPAAVTLSEGATRRVSLPLSAGAPGDHEITVTMTTPDGTRLVKTLALGVRRNDPVTSETRRITLGAGESFILDDALFAGYTGQPELLVSAGAFARFDVPGLLRGLDRYPYGCTEQVTSQAMPLLSLGPVADSLDMVPPEGLNAKIGAAIETILARQAPNGAFGLWRAGSGDGFLDAYVTDFLSRARSAGHDVPERAFESALDNLSNRIAYAPDFDRGGTDIAYALYVLAQEGRASMGDLRYYADEKGDALATPTAQAQLGAALAAYGDQPRADRLFSLAAARIAAVATPERGGRRDDYGSTLRDTAAFVTLARGAGSTALDLDALTNRLATPGRPLSTQESAWTLAAAEALVADPVASGLFADGAPVEGPYLRRRAPGLPAQVLTTERATLLTLTTLGVPEVAPPAGGYGYALERAYYRLDGTPLTGQVAQGDRLVAVLTIRPAEETPARLIVDDPLPAGFEIDNPALLRAGDIAALDWLQTAETESAEFRTDRFIAAMDWQGAEPFRLAYMVRAVSPGDFHHPAALVEDMYRPEYRAVTATGRMSVAE
ncbi:MG2 domain protein [Roseivivax sp. THAF40]|uniref:alpha-2-macroglobulin family protein n=1 Tax=unclassified Roseivivax TaxID=2639302 RepID=UPI0012678857|nr:MULTISPECIES: alpha-2-macroglobulin family protein [unclassified Roseivivax]QFS84627.1 MG2 domain protein [Roseivivax sp. THAF197b]QFT48454.1 MG2 domain protein [Roseivivax sp. THAF40]